MKKKINYILLFVITMFIAFGNADALTIIETTNKDDYDTIANNTIVLGVTKFEPNVVLTAGKASLATYDDTQFNKDNENYEAPKIYYYLQGSWFLIDNDNNATVIEDDALINDLNEQDIFYVNNKEKIIEVDYKKDISDDYELIFDTNNKDKKIEYGNNVLKVPATISKVNVFLKEKTTENSLEMEKVLKDVINSTEYKIIKNEITGKDGTFKYAILENGKIQISRYLVTDASVVIPAEYDGYKVYSVGNVNAGTPSAQRYNIFGETDSISNTTVTSITLSEGIEKLEMAAFSGCTGLKGTITFPSTLKEIGRYAFNKCSKISGPLIFPENLTVIGQSAFQNCSSLTGTLKIPSKVTRIEPYTFNGCSNLTGDLVIPEGVTYLGKYAFQNCKAFNGKLTLPSTLVEFGDGAFNHCSKLTNETVVIPKNVKTIGENDTDGTHVFYDFANNTIKEFIVEEGNEYFKAIDGVLFNKEGTRLVAYPSSRPGEVYEMPEGVTIIDELGFSRAGSPWHLNDTTNKLKKLILPNSYKLTTEIPSNYLNTGSNIAVGIYKYTGIVEIAVKEDNPNYKTIDGVLYSKDGTTLWYVPIRKSGEIVIPEGVTTIEKGALYSAWDRESTQKIKIPASVTHIDDQELEELKILGKNKVTFDENCIYEFKTNGSVGKK